MANIIFEYPVLIKEFHLDSFGHMTNTAYVELYEEARWDFITKNGFGLETIKTSQVGPVILDLQLKFKRELKNRESIIIKSQTIEVLNSKMLILDQKMIRTDGKIASEALFTVGFLDLQLRKLVDTRPEWLRAVGVVS